MKDPVLVHGGALHRMQRLFPGAPRPWLDLSTGINPWPYRVGGALHKHLARLPDEDLQDACQAAMAQAYGAPREAVLPAPGSEALIRLLPRLIRARTVIVPDPSYGDHGAAWRAAGAIVEAAADPLARAGAADVLVIVNPNNPDGRSAPPEALADALAAQVARGGWLVVDEAFVDLLPRLSLAKRAGARGLVVLRSFGKFFGLAGLRLGALLGPPDMLAAAREALGIWAVSGPALAIGAMAYADARWAERTRARLQRARLALDGVLRSADLAVVGGTDLFRFVAVEDAEAMWGRLGWAGIAVRRFSWSPSRIRIGLPASAAARGRLASALQGER